MDSVYLSSYYNIAINSKVDFKANFKAEIGLEYDKFDVTNRQDFISLMAAHELFFAKVPTNMGVVRARWSSINDSYPKFSLSVFRDVENDDADDVSNDSNYFIRIEHTGRKHLKYSARIAKDEYTPPIAIHDFTNKDIDKAHTLNAIKEIDVKGVEYE